MFPPSPFGTSFAHVWEVGRAQAAGCVLSLMCVCVCALDCVFGADV